MRIGAYVDVILRFDFSRSGDYRHQILSPRSAGLYGNDPSPVVADTGKNAGAQYDYNSNSDENFMFRLH